MTGHLQENRAPGTEHVQMPLMGIPAALLSTPSPVSRQLLHIAKSKTQGIRNLLCILMPATVRAYLSWNKQHNSPQAD